MYTIVRIKSILAKYTEMKASPVRAVVKKAVSDSEKALMLEITKFNSVIENAYEEKAPHKICAYVYELANAFNRFYHETKILAEENEERQMSFISMLLLTKEVFEACINMLGFEAPERM